jgi:hypothetical protein
LNTTLQGAKGQRNDHNYTGGDGDNDDGNDGDDDDNDDDGDDGNGDGGWEDSFQEDSMPGCVNMHVLWYVSNHVTCSEPLVAP